MIPIQAWPLWNGCLGKAKGYKHATDIWPDLGQSEQRDIWSPILLI